MPGRTLSSKALSVVANPFVCPLSPDGFPVAMVAFDPDQLPVGAPPRLIGAQLVRTIVESRANEGGRRQSRREAKVFYNLTAQAIPDTAYHRALVRSGELLAADADTWRIVSPPKKDDDRKFAAPDIRLAADASERIAEWSEAHPDEAPPVAAWFADVDDKGKKITPRISGWKFEI